MIRLLFLLLCCPFLLLASEHSSFESENPVIYQHVNVITGHLTLQFEDGSPESPFPIILPRNYSSSGALDFGPWYSEESNLILNPSYFRAGWTFFPHLLGAYLHHKDPKKLRLTFREPQGTLINYFYDHEKESDINIVFLKPKEQPLQFSGLLGGQSNPHNNLVEVNLKTRTTTIHLPNGGKRIYIRSERELGDDFEVMRLIREKLPNGHQLIYTYDNSASAVLKKIEYKNPSRTKTLSSISFSKHSTPIKGQKAKKFVLQALGSDGKRTGYRGEAYGLRNHLLEVTNNWRPKQSSPFLPLGSEEVYRPRIYQFALSDQEQFFVTYYSYKQGDKFVTDKVAAIHESSLARDAKKRPKASFRYLKDRTEVFEQEGGKRIYFHDGEKPLSIDYYTNNVELSHSQKFIWKDKDLKAKELRRADGSLIFSKTFVYDSRGNVIKETLSGCLTGQPCSDKGGLETFTREYSYSKQGNHLTVEKEEGGLERRYVYLPHTNLLTAKYTLHQGKILQREFLEYDENHLLICEKIDDGTSVDPGDLTGVTEQRIKRYVIDPDSYMPKRIVEGYLDLLSKEEISLQSKVLSYAQDLRPIQEEIFDRTGTYRYTIHTEYNAFGQITLKTTPLGQKNVYRYDHLGRLIEVKEVGSPTKRYTYDQNNHPTSFEEVESGKTSLTVCDGKGRALSKTDSRGHTTLQKYDAFGHCIKTTFPDNTSVCFAYDELGNLISTKMPLGEKSSTEYNLWRKPIRIQRADGSELLHLYSKRGLLIETLHPDGTKECFNYDPFDRMIEKISYSSTKEELAREYWVYNTFHLLSYTDPRGLVTRFFYDGSGRKIASETEKKRITYTYDALGHIERVDDGVKIEVKIHDVGGRVVEQYEEDHTGKVEQRMEFSYDEENRKVQAIRHPSAGTAIDSFGYDTSFRLISHTDPEGHHTEWIYEDDFINSKGEKVLRKTLVNALNIRTIELFDINGKVVSKCKQNAESKTSSYEEYLYDPSGNRTTRLTTIYRDAQPVRNLLDTWAYDAMGRVIEEKHGNKVTGFTYDRRGRMVKKTLPSGVYLTYAYDGLDRLLALKSSDGTIDNLYRYAKGSEPIELKDSIHGTVLHRSYNLFGQLIEEQGVHHLFWEYDDQGRLSQIILPDRSSICYSYRGMHLASVARCSPSREPLYSHDYVQFDAMGHPIEESLVHSVGTKRRIYDLLERPLAITSPWHKEQFSYGPTGLVMFKEDSLHGKRAFAYDPLEQLIQEGEESYHFDSLGNPASCLIGETNELLQKQDRFIAYDLDGNPREDGNGANYRFDPLGRLIEITSNGRSIQYLYDPLSRLISKTSTEGVLYYLYDQEHEIGTLDEEGSILQLKVLGLGVRSEIGAAVSIELLDETFIPLNDLNGNIIGLINTQGKLVEHYDILAFGQEICSTSPQNPWRFCSKRRENALIFFGKRFYDPSLGRWLTPDPAGFQDGANLYAYVRNNPLNRLDLFGLFSDQRNQPPGLPVLYVPIPSIGNLADGQKIACRANLNGRPVDFIVSCNYWSKLQFSPEELKAGKFDILGRLGDLATSSSGLIVLNTFVNGINVSLPEFEQSCDFLTQELPGGVFIGMYNNSEGILRDVVRATTEINGIETQRVSEVRQFLIVCAEAVHKISPNTLTQALQLWFHQAHSEGGVLTKRAIQGMTPDQKALIKNHLLYLGLGPAALVSKNETYDAVNVFSRADSITGNSMDMLADLCGVKMRQDLYEVRFVPCISKWPERSAYFADHAHLGSTYRQASRGVMNDFHKKYGFYENNRN